MAIRRFSGGVSAPRCARRAVREELWGALPQPKLADVELIVSELATNSVRPATRTSTPSRTGVPASRNADAGASSRRPL